MSQPTFIRLHAHGVYLAVKLQPRASTNEICQPLGNELKIKVTAPPVDAAANQALVDLLAEKFARQNPNRARPNLAPQNRLDRRENG